MSSASKSDTWECAPARHARACVCASVHVCIRASTSAARMRSGMPCLVCEMRVAVRSDVAAAQGVSHGWQGGRMNGWQVGE